MSRYKYLGEPNFSFVDQIGPTTLFRVPQQDGSVRQISPPDGQSFIVGQDIGADITDPTSVRVMDADSRFEKIG